MYAKRAKRKCGVRGCHNITDVFAISLTREAGNTVILCAACAQKALGAMEEAKKVAPDRQEKAPEPLFFAQELQQKEPEQKETAAAPEKKSGAKRKKAGE